MASLQYIQDLDLHYLVYRLVNKHGWNQEEAMEAVRKYKNFLSLKVMYPEFILVPTLEIDEVWHNHILHTKNYTHDCEQIFGSYLHHTPSTSDPEEKEALERDYAHTIRLYEKTFKESYEYGLDIASWQENPFPPNFSQN